jgi:lipid A 3-O-deacylase
VRAGPESFRSLALLLLLTANSVVAADLPAGKCPDDKAIRLRGFTARLENDLFVDTDRNYTNGVSLTAISQDLPADVEPDCLPWPARLHAALIRGLNPGFWRDDGAPAKAQNVVVTIGQSMYTPSDPERTDLIADDRPYAGLLYVGLSWNRRRHDPKARMEKLDTREITLGVIGPLSLAEDAQDFIHDVRGLDKFNGWHNQLKNEPAVQLAREQKYRDYRGPVTMIPGFSTDTVRALGLRLGNIETSASAGIEGRIGWNLPNDFGSYPIRPAAENRPPAPASSRARTDRFAAVRPGAHLFGALEAKLVAHDFSLDGNLFRDSHSVTRRPFVVQAAFGFSIQRPVAGHGVRLAVMRVYRSREFEEQRGRHSFGSIALSVEF